MAGSNWGFIVIENGHLVNCDVGYYEIVNNIYFYKESIADLTDFYNPKILIDLYQYCSDSCMQHLSFTLFDNLSIDIKQWHDSGIYVASYTLQDNKYDILFGYDISEDYWNNKDTSIIQQEFIQLYVK